jgi:hypothetical protein
MRKKVTQSAGETLDPHILCKVKAWWAEDDTMEMDGMRKRQEGWVLIHGAYPLAWKATFEPALGAIARPKYGICFIDIQLATTGQCMSISHDIPKNQDRT